MARRWETQVRRNAQRRYRAIEAEASMAAEVRVRYQNAGVTYVPEPNRDPVEIARAAAAALQGASS